MYNVQYSLAARYSNMSICCREKAASSKGQRQRVCVKQTVNPAALVRTNVYVLYLPRSSGNALNAWCRLYLITRGGDVLAEVRGSTASEEKNELRRLASRPTRGSRRVREWNWGSPCVRSDTVCGAAHTLARPANHVRRVAANARARGKVDAKPAVGGVTLVGILPG